jgi:hypothetical protein
MGLARVGLRRLDGFIGTGGGGGHHDGKEEHRVAVALPGRCLEARGRRHFCRKPPGKICRAKVALARPSGAACWAAQGEGKEGNWAAGPGEREGRVLSPFFNKNFFSLFCFKLLFLFEIVLDFQTF